MSFEFECRFIKHTEMAVLVEHLESETEHWIPRSIIMDDADIGEEGTNGKLEISTWFARKLGFT